MRKTARILFAVMLISSSTAWAEPLCFEEAGEMYNINPRILRAIAKVESNYNPRAVNWNTNGSYDFGIMQINSLWAPVLGKKAWNELGDPCTNIKTGAMILSDCMKSYGYSWEAIGCYNSRTPDKRDRYARLVFNQLQQIGKEEKKLKESFRQALEEKIEEVAAAEAAGGKMNGSMKLKSGLPLSNDLLKDMVASVAEQSAGVQNGVELDAPSQFSLGAETSSGSGKTTKK